MHFICHEVNKILSSDFEAFYNGLKKLIEQNSKCEQKLPIFKRINVTNCCDNIGEDVKS